MNRADAAGRARNPQAATGLLAAFAAFLTWGFLPLYFNLIGAAASPWEVLLHRVLWTVLLLGALVLATGRAARVRAVFADRRLAGALAVTALLVAVNWGTFIWAVVNRHVVQTSLGYYINPLLNVALGFVFLGERLRPFQWCAVGIAAAGVTFSVVAYGTVPWISLVLAGCFGCYGLIRKQLAVDSVTGLLVETLLLSPFALLWFAWLAGHGDTAFFGGGLRVDALLIGAGVLTIVPFVLFAVGARRLRLATIGLVQYLTPTLQFISGVALLGEPFTRADAVTFTCIWVGLAIYSADLIAAAPRRAAAAPH